MSGDVSVHSPERVLSCFVLIGGQGRLLELWSCLVFKIVFLSPDMPLLVGVICIMFFCLLVFSSASACGVACISVLDCRDCLGCEGVFWTIRVCSSYGFVSMFEK